MINNFGKVRQDRPTNSVVILRTKIPSIKHLISVESLRWKKYFQPFLFYFDWILKKNINNNVLTVSRIVYCFDCLFEFSQAFSIEV